MHFVKVLEKRTRKRRRVNSVLLERNARYLPILSGEGRDEPQGKTFKKRKGDARFRAGEGGRKGSRLTRQPSAKKKKRKRTPSLENFREGGAPILTQKEKGGGGNDSPSLAKKEGGKNAREFPIMVPGGKRESTSCASWEDRERVVS